MEMIITETKHFKNLKSDNFDMWYVSRMLHSKFPCMHSYSTSDVIGVHENSDSYVFKKFINAAVYVEKSIKKLGPDFSLFSETMKIKKTKRCTCWIDADSCTFHPSMASGDGLKYTKSENIMKFDNKKVQQQLNDTGNDKLIEIREKQRAINARRTVSSNFKKNHHELFEKGDDKKLNLKLEDLEEGISPKAVPSKINLGESNNIARQGKIQEGNISRPQKEIDTILLPQIKENQPEKCREYAIEEDNKISENESTSSSPSSSTLTGCTVRLNDVKTMQNDTKLCLSSMTSCRLSANESVKEWLTRKLEEQKKKKINILQLKKRKEIEREKILEKERENFKLWLAEKKKIEEKEKVKLKKLEELNSLRELEKEKMYLKNRIEYELWVKKKREEKIERENKEHLKTIQAKIDTERRMLINQEAFENWLKSSKNKPKPIPLNRGLDSLRSSVSVTYINPVPWVPNIDQKPASQ